MDVAHVILLIRPGGKMPDAWRCPRQRDPRQNRRRRPRGRRLQLPLRRGQLWTGLWCCRTLSLARAKRCRELKLHYLTLGTPHRNAAGHVDNAVLLLHGTGGNAHSLLNPLFSDVLFAPGAPLDITKYFLILPDDIGHGRKLEAVGRAARAFSRLRLRRHGARPAHDARRNEDRPSAADPGNVNGLHAELCVGRNLSRICRCADAACLPAGARLRGATA